MKRKYALLLMLILTLCVVFAACSTPTATDKKIRWEKSGEKHVFNISLVNLDTISANTQIYGDTTYYQDALIVAAESSFIGVNDQLAPLNASGTYTYEIGAYNEGNCTVTTEQILYTQYPTEKLADLLKDAQWATLNVTGTDEDPFKDTAVTTVAEQNNQTATLKSVTKTSVTFKWETQEPVSSINEVDGFYIGEVHQEISKYKTETVYDFTAKRPTATVTLNDNKDETVVTELAKNSAVTIIDANQLLTYARSFDKSSTSFQDSPSAYVFDASTNKVLTANLKTRFEYDFKAILTDNTKQQTQALTSVNLMGISISGYPYMIAENLPDTLVAKDLDTIVIAGDKTPKLTTVRFRVGYLAYELASYDSALWQALTAQAA